MSERKKVRFAFRHINSPVAYCALSARVGTRDENPAFSGLAHLTEHMLFKGTRRRGSASINNALERVGGELNAYTTKEEIVLHATVLKEDLPAAADLLSELAFTSVFPSKELEKELEVIYDEIISYKDSPADAIYDHFEELLFEGHPLSFPILGEKRTLKRITSGILQEFLSRSFIPENMAFTITADWPEEKAVRLVEKKLGKYFPGGDVQVEVYREEDTEKGSETEEAGGFENGMCRKNAESRGAGTGREHKKSLEIPSPSLAVGKKFNLEFHKKNHQVHCILGCSAYSLYESGRIPLALLSNILGGPASGSRLNMALREKNALVYNVETNYTPYSDTGIFTIYFGCDKPHLARCLELVRSEIEKIVNVPLTDRALRDAKKQLLGQLSIASDNAEAQCLSMGKSLMVYNKIEPMSRMRCEIEGVTAARLRETAREVLRWERLSVLIYK